MVDIDVLKTVKTIRGEVEEKYNLIFSVVGINIF